MSDDESFYDPPWREPTRAEHYIQLALNLIEENRNRKGPNTTCDLVADLLRLALTPEGK